MTRTVSFRMPGRPLDIVARVCVVLALIVVAWQLTLLVRRAGRGESDFAANCREATRLERLGGELYATVDERTGWPCCLPPSGMVLFSGVRHLSPTVAGLTWAVVNLVLLGGCIVGVVVTLSGLQRAPELHRQNLGFSIALLLVLSSGSLQTGQLSVLFVACWMTFMAASMRGRQVLAGVALAVPAALKFYPAVLIVGAVFLKARRQVLAFAVAVPLLMLVPPAFVYGISASAELWSSYLHNSLLGEGSTNVVRWRLRTEVLRNQSLDMFLLRYFTSQEEFQTVAPHVPHLDLPESAVLLAANAVRVAVLAFTALAAWRWLRRARPDPASAVLMMTAVWVAAMYLVLPEAKDRYAVYTFPAFLPVLAAGAEAVASGRRLRAVGFTLLIVLSMVLVMGVPPALQQLSVGLLGPTLLWATNCTMLWSDEQAQRSASDCAACPII